MSQQIVAFTPPTNTVFQFNTTLDGTKYKIIVNWNLFGARWYVNIYTMQSKLVVCTPLIGSPLGVDISNITQDNNLAVVTLATPLPYPVGSIVPLLIAGTNPTAYQGTYNCAVVNSTTVTFAFNGDDTTANSTQGTATYSLSMTAGYFNTPLVYQPDAAQFVIG